MGEWLAWVGVGGAVIGAGLLVMVMQRASQAAFERRRAQERARLLARLADATPGAEPPVAGSRHPTFDDVGAHPPGPAQLGDGRDDFTPLLVEYYAYGLTQARTSFATSQGFSAAGAAVLLFGVVLAVWKAESGGELYLGIVTSSVGLVTALVGQLFHRRADLALAYMADQTSALRDDRRAAESTQQAIGLLDEVADPELRGRLQAALILKLSGAGAELPR
ncbi:TRADD-N-associated membrane domain-containing protein [Streptomyces subrutilus]|uniref:TRADD-N-associated membrane domain-containing protein n=1 Tax=Streptomyces subrutilus TaxID=36818 RepID=UPI003409F79D